MSRRGCGADAEASELTFRGGSSSYQWGEFIGAGLKSISCISSRPCNSGTGAYRGTVPKILQRSCLLEQERMAKNYAFSYTLLINNSIFAPKFGAKYSNIHFKTYLRKRFSFSFLVNLDNSWNRRRAQRRSKLVVYALGLRLTLYPSVWAVFLYLRFQAVQSRQERVSLTKLTLLFCDL